MAETLITGSNRRVLLVGGAKADNVFWQVGTSTTLGTGSVMKGNLLTNMSITMNTGASLEGRALTFTGAVTLDSNTITQPAR
jgi:type VI secretion system secreted protein VgrG